MSWLLLAILLTLVLAPDVAAVRARALRRRLIARDAAELAQRLVDLELQARRRRRAARIYATYVA